MPGNSLIVKIASTSFIRYYHIGNPRLLISIILFTWIVTSSAQNCSKIDPWLEKTEFYAVGIDVYILDAYTIMKLISPAFLNAHFKPVFTEPEIYYMMPYFETNFRRIHRVLMNSSGIDAIWMLASGGKTGLDFEPYLTTLFY